MDIFFKTLLRGICKIFFVLAAVLCLVRPHLVPMLAVVMGASVFSFISVGNPNRRSS